MKMTPVPIGYFAKKTLHSSSDLVLPANIEEVCNVACASPEPEDWIDLWLHNEMWMYDTELIAWAVLTDPKNLQTLQDTLSKRWDGVSGSIQKAMADYIARHAVLPDASFPVLEVFREWDLYAYRAFPVRFVNGREEPFTFPELQVQPIPENYEHLGFDPVSRECDSTFGHSPLFCNGWGAKTAVNRFCLLDDPMEAFRLARHFSDGKYTPGEGYSGPAEPGPYFVMEVLRRKLPAV